MKSKLLLVGIGALLAVAGLIVVNNRREPSAPGAKTAAVGESDSRPSASGAVTHNGHAGVKPAGTTAERARPSGPAPHSIRSATTGEASREAMKATAANRPSPDVRAVATTLTATAASRARTEAEAQFQPFFATRQIDEEKRRAVLDLMADQQVERREITRSARENQLPEADAARLRRAAVDKYNGALKDILGEAGANAFNEYGAALLYQPIAHEFAGMCATQGTPVSPDTTSKVALILSQCQTVEPRGTISPQDFQTLQAQLDATALEQAGRILTAQQLAVFKRVLLQRSSAVAATQPRP